MKAACAPLIYGRTYQVDFGSGFLIRPKFMTAEDAAEAFAAVRSSMDAFDLAQEGGRTLVFGNGRIAVIGVTVIFEELFKECGREPVCHRLDHENGRAAYGFTGVAIPVGDAQGALLMPRAKLLDLYCRCISPIWNDEYAEGGGVRRYTAKTTEMTFEQMPEERVEPFVRAMTIGSMDGRNTVVLDSGEAERDVVAAAAMALALSGRKIAFCSDVDGIRLEKAEVFNVMTSRSPAAYSAPPSAGEKAEEQPRRDDAKPADTGRVKRSGGGYDDVLARLDGDDDGQAQRDGADALTRDVRRRLKSLGESWGVDAAAILGAAAGVVYVIVGAATEANPIILVIAGAATTVLMGYEAKRLIERYRK